MKKYRFLFFCFLFLPFLLSSCNEWLNVKPEDEIDEDDLFSTGEGYRHALNGIYYTMSLKDLYGMQMTWGVVDALGQTYDYYRAGGVNEMDYGASRYDWKHEALEPVIESIWKGSYNVVANCNQLIQRIEHADAEMFYSKDREKAMIWGEALGLRAFLQFDMLRLFAAAPVTNPASRKFIPYIDVYPSYISTPKTVDECLTLIERDLKEAQKLLWVADTGRLWDLSRHFKMMQGGERTFLARRGYRLNYWAATALLARVYLYAGKNAEALEEASKVIKFASENRVFTYDDLSYTGDTKLFSDVIWGMYVIDLLKYNTTVNDMSDAERPRFLSILEPDKIFFKGDLYLKKSGNIYTQMSNDRRFMTWIEDYENYQEDFRFRKYDVSPRGNLGDAEVANTLMPMIRMSEVYYIAAEALYSTGAEGLAKAKSYLERVKKGRGLLTSDQSFQDVQMATEDNFMEVLIADMCREWLGEGQNFFIYKRLNQNIPAERGSVIKAEEKIFVVPVPDCESL